MSHPKIHQDVAHESIPAPHTALPAVDPSSTGRDRARWEARFDLERCRAETERLQVLVEFLGRPVHAHGGSDPDPDIITAYNLAVEDALQGIRRAAAEG